MLDHIYVAVEGMPAIPKSVCIFGKFPIKQETNLRITNLMKLEEPVQKQQKQQQHRRQHPRDKVDLFAKILEALLPYNIEGVIVSRIRYKARLSDDAIKRYLAVLCCNGLIEMTIIKRKLLRLTEKGIEFLHLYRQMHDMLPLSC